VQVWGASRNEIPGFKGLVHIDPLGDNLWEVEGPWTLLAVSPDDGAVYLWDPEGPDPARILIAEVETGG